jgi:outer membrane autotransporter protein
MHLRRTRAALLLATSSAAALIAAGAAPARAACAVVSGPGGFTNPAGHTTSCVTAANATVTGNVVNAGTITPGGPTGILIFDSTLNGAVINSGTIAAGRGIYINNANVSGGIINSGMISASHNGIFVQSGTSFSGGISNSGTISSQSAGNLAGIFVQNISSFAGGISNSGAISRGSFGFTEGIYIEGVSNFSGGVSNRGTISAIQTGILAGASTFAGGITNTGVISGVNGINLTTGGISVFNSGTITATGIAILFAGSGNTLTLGPGSAITGNVVGTNTDAFQLGGTGSDSFNVGRIGPAQQYQGFATFAKVGDSTWTLTGTTALVLPWTVQQGTLNVAAGASLPNSPFTVQAGVLSVDGTVGAVTLNGGTLFGTGTLGSLAVGSGGTVAPGHSIGTLTIVGNVSFAAGSIYQAQTNAAGQSDLIRAGTATLAGGTVQAQSATGAYGPSTSYTILTASGGRTGTFAGVTDSLPYLTASLSYDANDVFLTLTRNATFFQSQAATPNQRAVASGLDRFATNDPLFLAAASLTGATTQQALDALSGEIHASVQTTLVDDSRFMRYAMLGRLRQAAYAGAPGTMAALGFDGPTLAYQDPKAFPVKAPPLAAPVKTPDIVYWAQGVGAWGSVDSDGNAASVSRSLGGFFTGVDASVGDFSRAGLAGGYTHSSVTVGDRASSAGIDTAHLGAYAGTSLAGFNLRSGAAIAFHTIDTDRTIAFPGFFDHATAHYDGNTGQVFGEVGYGLATGPVAVEPFAGAAWVRLMTDSFAEAGGPAALAGAGSSDCVGFSSLGIRVATSTMLPNGVAVIPRATVAWQHAFNDLTPSAVLAFESNGVGDTIAGAPIARDAALVDAGFDLRISPQAKVGLSYAGELASTARDNAVKGNFTWNF